MGSERVDIVGGGSGPAVTPLGMLEKPTERRHMPDMGSADPLSGDAPMSLPQMSAPSMYMPPTNAQRRMGSGEPQGRPQIKQFRTLEELYSYNEQHLRTQGFQLRVVRNSPRHSLAPDGTRIFTSGIIAYENSLLSTAEFARKYGGISYDVFLQVPHATKTLPDGVPLTSDVAMAHLDIPGDPNLDILPIAGDSNGGGMFPPSSPFQRRAAGWSQQPPQQNNNSGPDAGVVREVLQFADRSRANQPGPSMSDAAIGAIAASSNQAATMAREMSAQQVAILQQQHERAMTEVQSLRDQLLNQRKEPSEFDKTMQMMATMRSSGSTDQVDTLLRRHSDEIQNLERRHQEDVAVLTRTNDASMDRATKGFESEIRRSEERVRELQLQFDRERIQLKDEADRRERAAQNQVENKFSMMKEQLENRIKDIEIAHDREIRQIKDSHDKELRSNERLTGSEIKVSEKTQGMQMNLMQQDLQRINAELAQAKMEVEQARAERLKPLTQQVQEIRATAEALGMTGESAEKEGMGEKLFNIFAQNPGPVLGVVGALAQKVVPSIAGNAQQQPQQMQQAQQRRALPAQGQQQQHRRQPPQMVFSEDNSPRVRTVEQRAQPGVIRQPSPPSPTAQVVQNQSPPPSMEVPVDVEVPVNTIPSPPAQDQAQPQSQFAGMEWMGLTEQNLQELLNYLEGAYSQEKPEREVAAEMVAQHGPDLIRLVLSNVPARRLAESIKVAPATRETALARKKGQKWLQYVWAELAKAVAQ